MQIFHIALVSEWKQARQTGTYTTSTLGKSLAEEGFIHASRREQVAGVFANFYRGVRKPLVLLTIETDRLVSPWREEAVGDDTFPHIYGPLNVNAVVAAQPLNKRGGTDPFLAIFFRESMSRILIALAAMGAAVAGASLGARSNSAWGPFLGAMGGLLIAVTVVAVVVRRRKDAG